MEKIKEFLKKNCLNILYIMCLIGLSVAFLSATIPNIDVDVRIEHNNQSTVKTTTKK